MGTRWMARKRYGSNRTGRAMGQPWKLSARRGTILSSPSNRAEGRPALLLTEALPSRFGADDL